MSSPSNEFTYGKKHVVNLSDGSQSVPARVHTRLRVTTELTAREVQEHKGRTPCVPTYIFGHGGELPLHPSLQAGPSLFHLVVVAFLHAAGVGVHAQPQSRYLIEHPYDRV
jgi:hypothetical protein